MKILPQNPFFKYCIILAFILLAFFCPPGCKTQPPVPPGAVVPGDNGQNTAEDDAKEAEERLREERRLREEALKEELGSFFVPLPPLEQPETLPFKARGIYVTGNIAGLEKRFQALLDMVEATELNAVVIDVKNDHGLVTYKSSIEIVKEVEADKGVPIKNIVAVMKELENRDIYPIARIVVFRDPNLPEQRPAWAIQKKEGGIWRDKKGYGWVNPYDKRVWDYNIAIAKEAALLGFKEIQFDYIRFPENAHIVDREAYFPENNGLSKDDAIKGFLNYAREQLKEYKVQVAADVFGVIATSWGDADKIGQNWEKISPLADVICPMVYPSHYGPGYFGFSVPDARPAGTISKALADAINRNAPLEKPAKIRPWLQGFTATWVKGYIPYGPKEIRLQIDAALELGIDEFLIWNAGNRYNESAFWVAEEAEAKRTEEAENRENKGYDVLGRTSNDALNAYMEALQKRTWRQAYTLQGTGFSMNHEDYRQWFGAWSGRLTSYSILSSTATHGNATCLLDITVTINGDAYQLHEQPFRVYLENQIWRVEPPEEFLDLLCFLPAEAES